MLRFRESKLNMAAWRKTRKVKLISENQAQGRVRQIFAEAREVLGLPQAGLLLQAYAAYPEFLEIFWQGARPTVETQEFFTLAGRLNADSYTRVHNYLEVPDLSGSLPAGDPAADLNRAVDMFQYHESVLLLLAAAQLQAFEGVVLSPPQGTRPAEHPDFTGDAALLEVSAEALAQPQVRRVFEDMKTTLGVSHISRQYLGFAHWPEFLRPYWSALKTVLRSPLYTEIRFRQKESALSLSAEVPEAQFPSLGQMEDAGLNDDEVTALVQITEKFVNNLSGQILNVAFARIGIEGGTARAAAKKEPVPVPAELPKKDEPRIHAA